MSDFTEVAVGEHLKLTSGFPFPSSQFSNEGFPLIRIRDVLTSQTETYFQGAFPPGYVIKKGDILIGMDGDFHVVKWRGRDALLNQRVLKIDVQTEEVIVLDYLFYWLGPFIKKINDITAATTVKHLSTKDLVKAIAKFPEVAAQRKIAAILTSIDTAIEKTEALIEKYRQIKAGLMHDLFTRGVLPNGQLRPPHTQAPELYQETEIGWIPKEFDSKNLREVCFEISDGAHYSVTRCVEGIPFLFVSCVKNGRILWDDAACISSATYEEISKKSKPYRGMILFTVVGSYGHAAYVPTSDPFGFERNIAYLKPNTVFIEPKFLYYWLMSSCVKNQVERLVIGNAQKVLTLGNMGKVFVSLPRADEQKAIVSKLESIDSVLNCEQLGLAKLKDKKLGLMQDLLTGKVQVKVDEPLAEASSG